MKRRLGIAAVAACLVCLVSTSAALAHGPQVDSRRSITDRGVEWPAWSQWQRVFLLKDYNTRVVVIGTTLLGCAAGMVGSFTLLRKRALTGDALSHATLPGIGIAFIVTTSMGGDGKSLPILLLGATVSGLIGVGVIVAISSFTRLKEDTALGAVLSVFFGAGMALLGVIQQMDQGHAAGLEGFIYGKAASMGSQDMLLIAAAAAGCISASVVLFKEFKLLCFDEGFAGSRGLPVVRLDLGLMGLVVVVTIVGLQAVGLVLMIALLVIPAASARFWTETMWKMFIISGVFGALGGMTGAGISALFSKLPSGAMIVLVCTAFFAFSLLFGTARGVVVRVRRRWRLNRNVDRQHLLRAAYELLESSADLTSTAGEPAAVRVSDLLTKRSWSASRLNRELQRSRRAGLLDASGEEVRLTETGLREAVRLTRQHRLWELYLITYADIAPGRVDRDADDIEHVLEPELISELESLLARNGDVPASPHELAAPARATARPALAEGS